MSQIFIALHAFNSICAHSKYLKQNPKYKIG